MARKKYTPKAFARAVERYFDSISRDAPVTEQVATGEVDRYGHPVFEPVPVTNRLGELLVRREFLVPPTVSDLCVALGIHRSTWAEYAKDPAFSDTTTHAQGVMRAWNEQQLLTRSGKDVRGIEFNLTNNFGYKDQMHLELGEQTRKTLDQPPIPLSERKALLEQIAREFAGEGEPDGKA